MDKAKLKETMLGGLLRNNPTFVLVLGTCPTIATTTSLFNSFAMGVATMFVLIFSNLFISLLRRVIPDRGAHPVLYRHHFDVRHHRAAGHEPFLSPTCIPRSAPLSTSSSSTASFWRGRRATPPATSRCTACWTAFRWGWASPARCA